MNNPQEFIDLLKTKTYPVLKSLAIAQACLESQYGKKHFYNNIYGIKCHNPNLYAGCRLGKTKEFIDGAYKDYRLAFQTYNSIDESIEDYNRLMNLNRYKPVREAINYIEATEQIKACGYATGISYVQSLRKIIEKYKLYELDSVMDKNEKLTDNFKFKEFWSNNFGNPKIEPPAKYFNDILYLAGQLQKVRDKLNEDKGRLRVYREIKIIVTSGYRTKEWNASKGVEGAANSLHLYGKAVDSRAIGIPLFIYYTYLIRYTGLNHIGYYNNLFFVHTGIKDNLIIFKF